MNKKYKYFFSVAAMVVLLCLSGHLKGQSIIKKLPAHATVNEIQQERQKKQSRVQSTMLWDIISGVGAFTVPAAFSVCFCLLTSKRVRRTSIKGTRSHRIISLVASLCGGVIGIYLIKRLRVWPDSKYKTDCSYLGAAAFPSAIGAALFGLIPVKGYSTK